jgi:hypothetical protein
MPDYYLLDRANITADYITTRRARELYTEAQRDPQSDLWGDLETGFYFWSIEPDTGLRLVHYSVTPAATEDVPEDIRERLDEPTHRRHHRL